MKNEIASLPLDAFPARTVQTLRYNDMDKAGHVNNAVYSTMFEAGRVPILYDATRQMPPSGCHFSIVRIGIDYLAEMAWPGDVTIATGVRLVGTSSVRFAQSVFLDGTCRAVAESTVVLTNSTTRRSEPLPAHARAWFGELMIHAGA